MRKQVLLPILAIMVVSLSCKKESMRSPDVQNPDQVITVKISPNQTYQINDAGTLSIRKQPDHYITSEANTNSESGLSVYKYQPTADFKGSDEVMLTSVKVVTAYGPGETSSCSSSGGSSNSTSVVTTNITIKITVDN